MGHMVNQIIFMFDQCISSNNVNTMWNEDTYEYEHILLSMKRKTEKKCMKINSNKATKETREEEKKQRWARSESERKKKEIRENRTTCLK